MKIIDVFVVFIILVVLSRIIYSKVKQVKKGEDGGCSCGGSSSNCSSSCQHTVTTKGH